MTGGNGTGTTYGFDNGNRLTSLAQSFVGTSNNVTWSFSLNLADQILGRSATNDNYTSHPGTQSPNYAANGLNQYASISATSFTYDGRGNLTSDGTRTFTYDIENRLLTGSAPTAVTLTYDPVDRLQTSTASSATTTFLYDGSSLVGEYNSSGTVLRRYVSLPGMDQPLLWYEGSGTSTRRWLATDNQGSVMAYSDASGNAGALYGYGLFGEPDSTNGWAGSRYRYTGQIMIPEAQIYYYKARVYDPGLGRFLQTDPVGYASDVNPYAYTANDPVNEADASGLCDAVVQAGGGSCSYEGNQTNSTGDIVVNGIPKPECGDFQSTCVKVDLNALNNWTWDLGPKFQVDIGTWHQYAPNGSTNNTPQKQGCPQPYNENKKPTNLPSGYKAYDQMDDGRWNIYMLDNSGNLWMTPDRHAFATHLHDQVAQSAGSTGESGPLVVTGGLTIFASKAVGFIGWGAGAAQWSIANAPSPPPAAPGSPPDPTLPKGCPP